MAQDTTRRMIGITTRYVGRFRIVASWADAHNGLPTSERKRITLEWDDGLDSGDNHFTAAQSLLDGSSRGENWQIVGRIDNAARGYMFTLQHKNGWL